MSSFSKNSPSSTTEKCPLQDEKCDLHISHKTETGDPIEDEAGYVLVHPDGSEEEDTLDDGKIEREDVPFGQYRLRYKYLEQASWKNQKVMAESESEMTAVANGFPDGTKVTFKVFEEFQEKSTPVKEVEASVKEGKAVARWKHEQKSKGSAGGTFIFEAWIGKKRATSKSLEVTTFPVDDMRGVQQRLKCLGYYDGKIDGICGPKTEQAVKQFQSDHPPLDVDGVPGPLTKRELAGW